MKAFTPIPLGLILTGLWGCLDPLPLQSEPAASAFATAKAVRQHLKQHGPGIAVMLGTGLAADVADLAMQSDLLFYIQSEDEKDVLAGRRLLERQGLLGTRVYMERGEMQQIHLASNLADVLWVGNSQGEPLDERELLRVLRPGGRLLQGNEVHIKPVPAGLDEWSHPYHGADNNPQSKDQLARAPYLTQFLATPWYGPMPQVTVSAGGRVFKAFGHLAFKKREWPLLGKLVAMNAFNGIKLWETDLSPGFMHHRNTIVATSDTLYLADQESCRLIETSTGKVRDRITIGPELSEGASWKWMALRDGILYALLGEAEKPYEVQRGVREESGWPWSTVRSTYGPHQKTWGYGKTLLAIDPASKEILWARRESSAIDSRAVCMSTDRIFLYSHQNYLMAVNISDGNTLWQTADPELLEALGDHGQAQDPRLGYATTAYAKCSDQILCFAGPQRPRLVVVSAADGRLLWQADDGNVQLVLRSDAIYAMGRMTTSKKYDYFTGRVLEDLQCFRGNCTRATGAVDSIFARGYRHTGTLRYDLEYGQPRRMPAMRPGCQDGVTIANGLLYWGPWMCDCNHSLVGVISLGQAPGGFDVAHADTQLIRDRGVGEASKALTALPTLEGDWTTYRANNQRNAVTPVRVSDRVSLTWDCHLAGDDSAYPDSIQPTASIAAGGMVFVGGSDGVVRALDAASGRIRWKFFTGGAIRYPPAVWKNRIFIGSGDGWVYALEAVSGRRIWKFRAAPAERKIPVYGKLLSTWPVAGGVMVEAGVVYAAAGIVCHDGTLVYALDARSGAVKWANRTSGNLLTNREVVGVSVQGHLLYHQDRVYLAGGNVVSPAIFDAQTGTCLNTLDQQPDQSLDDHWKQQRSARGSELFVVEERVVAAGKMLYSPPEPGPPSRYFSKYVLQVKSGDRIIQGTDRTMYRLDPSGAGEGKGKLLWKQERFLRTEGVVLTPNALLVIGEQADDETSESMHGVLEALDPDSGKSIWKRILPAAPVPWGLAVDGAGRIVVTLIDGRVLCFS